MIHQGVLAVPVDQLAACSAARTVAVSGLLESRPAATPSQQPPDGVPLGDVLRVQLSSGRGASVKLVCMFEGCRRCAMDVLVVPLVLSLTA